jgi:hypothetical protein
MLRAPCARNKATARLLLERASAHDCLTDAERQACRDLADDLDTDPPEHAAPPQRCLPAGTTTARREAGQGRLRARQARRRFCIPSSEAAR